MGTTSQGIWYPDAGTQLNPLQTKFSTLAESVDILLHDPLKTRTIRWFASSSDRDAAIPFPQEGVTVARGSEDTFSLQTYNGSAWVEIGNIPATGPSGVMISGTPTNVVSGAGKTFISGWTNPPNYSFGTTSTWRANPSTANVGVAKGFYQVNAYFAVARSGDTSSTTISFLVNITAASGGYFRPWFTALDQPNNRFPVGVDCNSGTPSSFSHDFVLPAAVTSTQVTCSLAIQRLLRVP